MDKKVETEFIVKHVCGECGNRWFTYNKDINTCPCPWCCARVLNEAEDLISDGILDPEQAYETLQKIARVLG